MKNKGFIEIIATAIISALLVAAGFTYYLSQQKLGATIPTVVADFETTLAAKISSSATTMQLTSASTTAGDSLSGYLCFTVDTEYICGTASSSNPFYIENLVRGIDPIDGDKEVTALKDEHRRGASVKITDHPQLAIDSRILNGQETLPNALSYATDTMTFTLNQQLINKKYADNLVIAAGSIGSWSLPGIFKLATTSELTAGTATSSYLGNDYNLIVPNVFFSSSSSASNIIAVTNSLGKLDPGFIATSSKYVWSGNDSFTGTLETATATINGSLMVNGTSSFSNLLNLATTTLDGSLSVSGTSTHTGNASFSASTTLQTATPTANSYEAATTKYVEDRISTFVSASTTIVIGSTTVNWVDWDLSSVVPAGTTYVEVVINAASDGSPRDIGIRAKGSTASSTVRTTVNVVQSWTQTVVVGTAMKIQHYCSVNGDSVRYYLTGYWGP